MRGFGHRSRLIEILRRPLILSPMEAAIYVPIAVPVLNLEAWNPLAAPLDDRITLPAVLHHDLAFSHYRVRERVARCLAAD